MSEVLPCARARQHALLARKAVQASLDIGVGETRWPPLATYSKCEALSEAISGAGRFVVTLGQKIDANTNPADNSSTQEDMLSG